MAYTAGIGWKFPVEVDETTGRIKLADYETDIAESIRIILTTSPGERVMRPDFGCGVRNFVFQTGDVSTLHRMEISVLEAIQQWELRVENVAVTARVNPDRQEEVYIDVSYTIKKNKQSVQKTYILP